MSHTTRWPRRRLRIKASVLTMAIIGTVIVVLAPNSNAIGASVFDTKNGSPGPATNTGATQDWTNLSSGGTTTALGTSLHFVPHQDKASGTGDDAFGQGAKEDIACPTVVSGSIPPNKSDLTRFYTAWEKSTTDGHYYLYLAWERTNNLGNANMDFEFNQTSTACSNGVTPNRTAGDRLVTFDFSGSGVPDLGLLTWTTTGATSQCFSGSSLPCWGNRTDLTAVGHADGSVNTSSAVNDPISFTDPVSHVLAPAPGNVVQNGFGEAGIDLTAAGIISTTTCNHFGSAELNSRSSSSFTSEIKDFIAPVPINITNCGSVHIVKTDDATHAMGGVSFHLWSVTGSESQHSASDFRYDGTNGHANYTCTTSTAANNTTADPVGSCTISNVQFGNYWVVEDLPAPTGFTAAQDQKATIAAGTPDVTLTFQDTREPATLIFHKQDDAGTAMANVTFNLYTDNGGAPGLPVSPAVSCTTLSAAANGLNRGDCEMTQILPDVTSGTNYWIVEDQTTLPAGYSAAASYEVHLNLNQSLDLRTGSSSTVHHTFVDPRIPANVVFHKQDDAGVAMPGVTFTLNSDNSGAPGTATGTSCTTLTAAQATAQNTANAAATPPLSWTSPLVAGDCQMTGILPDGTYWIVEPSPPLGYTGAAPYSLSVALAQNLDLRGTHTFVNTRIPANVVFHKQDDAGSALSGVGFTLYTDASGQQGSPVSPAVTCTTLSAAQATTLNAQTGTPFANYAAGDCQMTGILPPGTYWIVEPTPPTGYQGAASYQITLTLGQNLDLRGVHDFVDNRLFKIITLVCQEGTNPTLYSAGVAYGASGSNVVPPAPTSNNTVTSITSTDPNIVSVVCGITGGADPDLLKGSYPTSVHIG